MDTTAPGGTMRIVRAAQRAAIPLIEEGSRCVIIPPSGAATFWLAQNPRIPFIAMTLTRQRPSHLDQSRTERAVTLAKFATARELTCEVCD